ncbi:Epimerase family protein [Phycisphaerales bacterium]|nr:Epimerase family protein [Phycisphaerales bacterium]
MKIVIPGGSGQVGTVLAREFHRRGDQVLVLGRAPLPAPWRTSTWDGTTVGEWARDIDGADVVVNLAGRNVNCRYNAANRRDIMESRVRSVDVVGRAIAAAANPPRVWLQASTATIYAHRFDAANDEATGIIAGEEPEAPSQWRFSIEVARAWERALEEAATPRTRKVAMRSAMTMSPDRGGIFDVLLGLVRRGLGGRCGDGRQFVSWVHERDFIRAVDFLVSRGEMSGAVNICSPNPLPQAEFMRILRSTWGTRIGLPAARWMLEVGAVLLRTETELILKSRRVVPGRLLSAGFEFGYPDWSAAAAELCRRWRAANGRPVRSRTGDST